MNVHLMLVLRNAAGNSVKLSNQNLVTSGQMSKSKEPMKFSNEDLLF